MESKRPSELRAIILRVLQEGKEEYEHLMQTIASEQDSSHARIITAKSTYKITEKLQFAIGLMCPDHHKQIISSINIKLD